MAIELKPPLVAVCGRPNVGKSTLFNRITGRQSAIIHGEEGITRDRAYGTATWGEKSFRIVDTGGIVDHPLDDITTKMQSQVREALAEASVILFVVDGQQEITQADESLRAELFRLGKPVVLAVNKLDNDNMEVQRFYFYELGFGEPFAISSGHDRGISELLDAVVKHVPDGSVPVEARSTDLIKIAIVGKPNVGKSSFVNAILNEERAIVTDIPGTTRDAIDIEYTWEGKDYLLIDTAGMRRKGKVGHDVERFSVSRSLRAVNRADVAFVMIDAIEGVSEQDKRIFNYINERGTGAVIVWTKWDLVEDKEAAFKKLADVIDFKMPFLKYVPYLTVSNTERMRIYKTFEYADRVAAAVHRRIPTAELNKFFEDVQREHPVPTRRGKSAKIYYMTQVSTRPTMFIVFANDPSLIHWSYTRHIENALRERFGFDGVPLKLEVRGRKSERA